MSNNAMYKLANNPELWKYCYTRDFQTSFPIHSTLSPQHMYYVRSISGLQNICRERVINNMKYTSSLLHIILAIFSTMQHMFSIPLKHDFCLESGRSTLMCCVLKNCYALQKSPGYTLLCDASGLGIELAYTSNGWYYIIPHSICNVGFV